MGPEEILGGGLCYEFGGICEMRANFMDCGGVSLILFDMSVGGNSYRNLKAWNFLTTSHGQLGDSPNGPQILGLPEDTTITITGNSAPGEQIIELVFSLSGANVTIESLTEL